MQESVEKTGRLAHPVRCRAITEADLDAVLALFRRGFPDRSDDYWRRGLARHTERARPADAPTYGYLMESDGRAVGVLLTLFTRVTWDGEPHTRCNLSTWYVEPDYRPQGVLLDNLAMRRKDVTYLNVSPSPATWAMHEARGFRRYCRGQMLAFPALNRALPGIQVRGFEIGAPLDDLPEAERQLVADHAGYGCLCVIAHEAGEGRPFIFVRRRIGFAQRRSGRGQIPCLQLVYCRSTSDLPRFAGSVGRYLLRHHLAPLLVIDADGPIVGLTGRYFEGRAPKIARGPHPPRLGDLAYTELVLFGP